MAVITITEADLAKASTYIPIESKDRIARIVAAFCVEPADGENGAPVYRENRKLRQMFLMGILAEMYLHRDYRDPAGKARRERRRAGCETAHAAFGV